MTRHRPFPVSPLLSFPPSPSPLPTRHVDSSSMTTTTTTTNIASTAASASIITTSSPGQTFRRHFIVRICLMTPLFFISIIYFFAAYVYMFSFVIDYLWFEKHSNFKAFVYGIVFMWLEVNAFIAVWHCWYRGGGNISSSSTTIPNSSTSINGSNDEEQLIGSASSNRTYVKDDRPTSTMEHAGLLQNDAGLIVNQTKGSAAMRELNDLARAGGIHTSTNHQAGDIGETRGIQVKHDGSQRWCRKCRIPKPDRAHHCSSCRTCVLKMDHHCPWLGGGCVGWANYKFFLIFLLYSGALGIWVAVTTMKELVDFVALEEENYELAPVMWAILFFVGLIFGIAVGLFGLYHLLLTCQNRTTIESMEGTISIIPSEARPEQYRSEDHALSKQDRRRLERAQEKLNVYNLGWKENLKQVFGEDWRMWFVPFGWPPGDGYSFPIHREQLDQLRTITLAIRSGDTRNEQN